MNILRDDAERACLARRSRVSASPVRVARPLLIGTAAIVAAAAFAILIGLSVLAVVAVVLAVAIGSAHLARRTINSLLAGSVLIIARPFSPGERVRLYVPEFHEVVDAEIVRVGAANTTLTTRAGVLVVPNARLLRNSPNQPGLELTS